MSFLSTIIAATKKRNELHPSHEDFVSTSIYGSRFAIEDIPRYKMPTGEMPAKVACKLIKDELALDGNPLLNLASFVTTYMEEEVNQLILDNISKNFIDYDEYPQTCEIHNRCVNMIARLFNAPMEVGVEAVGCSTVGSSEAIILSCLALKRRWQLQRKAEGKSIERPNLIMGANVQVCWEKAVRYLEIEARMVDCTEELLYMDAKKAVELVDENTIGVVAILGSTYTGHYENVKELNDLLVKKKKQSGLDVPIHVDAASGGFVAPFVVPELEWDFRLPQVACINVSGHKYGLTYPGIGWAIWRSSEFLPEDLVFKIDYLGSDQASFTLNFSKNAFNIVAQYYVLIRFGLNGFTSIMKNLTQIADFLAGSLDETGLFTIMSERGGNGLPLVAFRLKEKHAYDEFDISRSLREHGWIVPAYHMAERCADMKMLRVVVREDFSMSRCHKLIQDIVSTVSKLASSGLTSGTESIVKKSKNLAHRFKLVATSISRFMEKPDKAKSDQQVKGAVC